MYAKEAVMAGDKKAKGKDEDEFDPKDGEDGGAEGAPAEGEASPKKKLSGRTIVLFIALPAVALIALGVGACFFLGVFGGSKDAKTASAEAAAEHAVFFDMPELLVNMTGGTDKPENMLKLSLSLELPNAEATAKVQAAMPRIIDSAQVFLRELRLDDLQGSAGMLRLREELLRRIDAAVAPVEVRDVLFKEIIVQ
jgi:flagellar FliL protein